MVEIGPKRVLHAGFCYAHGMVYTILASVLIDASFGPRRSHIFGELIERIEFRGLKQSFGNSPRYSFSESGRDLAVLCFVLVPNPL